MLVIKLLVKPGRHKGRPVRSERGQVEEECVGIGLRSEDALCWCRWFDRVLPDESGHHRSSFMRPDYKHWSVTDGLYHGLMDS